MTQVSLSEFPQFKRLVIGCLKSLLKDDNLVVRLEELPLKSPVLQYLYIHFLHNTKVLKIS